jgi:UTP--glucose-1-phosphate uridylyltransferase
VAAIRVAVFPAAGLGTRFLPATKAFAKEMLPLVDRPLVQYVVQEARDAGIERVVFVTAKGKSAMEDHFDIAFELERVLEQRGKTELLAQVRALTDLIHISAVRQKEALGSATPSCRRATSSAASPSR